MRTEHKGTRHSVIDTPVCLLALWRAAVGAAIGAVFAVGLGIAQMTNPRKVQGFLDISGDWDPSLAFVMGAAVLIALAGFRLVRQRGAPCLDGRFHLPDKTHVDRALLVGSALFGVGWGLSGFCPGPAISGLLTGRGDVPWFVPAMLVGGWAHRLWRDRRTRRQ